MLRLEGIDSRGRLLVAFLTEVGVCVCGCVGEEEDKEGGGGGAHGGEQHHSCCSWLVCCVWLCLEAWGWLCVCVCKCRCVSKY